MNARILLSVVVAFLIYGIWSWWSVRNQEGFAPFDINSQNYFPAETQSPPVEASIERVIAPSGPAAPSMAAPPSPPIVQPEETPFDPQSQSYESAELPERLRHPERLYGPGLINDQTQVAVESGVASTAAAITERNFQQFGPEFAQNGGFFLEGGVLANDSTVPTSYSSV